ncbi:MAG: glutamine--fructose-6-phosphate transaminase (isomerizing) [Planctomycetes bacterium]|nr:glutamine--fructose-6-phosphate transaminase (isomerizing) [Planctomycetota bacterium]
MCGIVGYTGPGLAVPFVLSGLQRLEYRGYDSAGIATQAGGRIDITRVVGRVADLQTRLGNAGADAHTAIGHTRWATHGRPTVANAHPHLSSDGRIALVHNGIIENYTALRQELEAGGFRFLSETDTEAAANLVASLYRGQLVAAVEAAIARIEGSFAFAVLAVQEPGLIVGARRGSPLAVGLGAERKEFFLASDAVPIVEHTRSVVYLDDDQVVALAPGRFELRAKGKPVEPRVQEIRWDVADVERGGYAHFMLKEIHEQPGALRRLAAKLIADAGVEGRPGTYPRFDLPDLKLDGGALRGVSRIVMVGQGTALHAAMVGRNMIERTARIPVQVEYGSDFRYRDPVLDPSVLVLAVSQSGETADTLGAIRVAREAGCKTVAVLNVQGSTLARESDGTIYMHVGPEIGVASTKAFTGQLAALYVFAIHLGILRGRLDPSEARRRVQDILQVPVRVEETLAYAERIEAVALKYKDATNALYLGRGTGYPLALEGALKLKEVSYIHAEGYDAAEMKHGPIALIDERMPVVILALRGRRYEKIVSNIQEVKARGGRVIAIASHDDAEIGHYVDDVIPVHDDRGIMNSIVCTIPLQLMAYHMAVARGCDVDKPRNLAKSVTVE